VFRASETEFTPDTTAELPAGLGTPRYSQHFQTRRVIRRPPPSPSTPFCAGWANRRAGVFCASETEITPDTTAELPAGLEAPRYSQHSQTRRVIRRPPPSPFKPFCAGWANRRAGVFCADGIEITPDTTAELPAGLEAPRHSQRFPNRRVIRRPPPSPFKPFSRRTHPPYDGPTVGRVCSARMGSKSPQTPPQNYPPDWKRLATPNASKPAG
jgi:hypothetical protein